MAITIRPYQSQVGINNASGGQAAQQRSAEAFMSQGQKSFGPGLNQLAEGIDKLNNVLFDAEIKKRNELRDLALIKVVQDYQSGSMDWDDNYRQQNQGENAVNAEADAKTFYEDRMRQAMEPWAKDKNATLYLQKNLGSIAFSGIANARDYGNQQLDVYRTAETNGQLALAERVFLDPRSTDADMQRSFNSWARMYAYNSNRAGLPQDMARLEIEAKYRGLQKGRIEQGFLGNLDGNNLAGAAEDLRLMKGEGDAASFVAQYESGADGSLAIGYDKNGGTSYGRFQISSKAGTFNDFLGWLDKNGHAAVADELRSSGPADTGSRDGETPKRWQKLVESGAITDEMQERFIRESHVDPALAQLPDDLKKAVEQDPALYNALFSTAVQHGATGAARLFSRNWDKAGGDRATFIEALYSDRKTRFGGSSAEEQATISDRLDREAQALGGPMGDGGGQPLFSQKEIKGFEKQLMEKTALSANTAIQEMVKDLPLDEQKAIGLNMINAIQDDQVREATAKIFNADIEIATQAQKSADVVLVRDFREYVQANSLTPSQAMALVPKIQGISSDARGKLVKELEGDGQKKTLKNQAALDRLLADIDLKKYSTEPQINAYAFDNGLTDDQIRTATEYLKAGGNAGQLKYTEVNQALKSMNNKNGLDTMPGFFEQVQQHLEPGKKVTEPVLRKTISNLLMDGERRGGSIFGYGADLTYSEALAAGVSDTWLPDVTDEEEEEIGAILRAEGTEVTGERIRLYKKHDIMGIPRKASVGGR